MARPISPNSCAVCHQPLLPEYYFCPNCGTEVEAPPLTTDFGMQLWIYAHSIFLPMVLFLSISKWKGYKYFRSEDPQAKQIGTIAIVLLIASTVITYYLAYATTMAAVQSALDSINADMGI